MTPAEYLPAVRDRFEKLLPPLTVTYQPNGRGLVNLAVVFATHQPTSLGHPHFILAGHLVDLTATPRWTVDFGDGQFGTYARPGGAYPDADLAHTYDHPGTFRVTVTATWVGQFSVDGLGPFAVDGPDLTQRQSVTVPVKEARAVLVG